ncbi:hypothetical protein Tco_0417796 [Tanacetum coccineum]
MAPKKRTTRSSPATTTTTTTPMTNEQLKALISQGVTDVLAERDATRSKNGKDSHDSGMGTEGVVELTQWFERIETVFCISNCTMENQIKFATCTFLESALTWWNSHVRTVGHDVAYAMTWTNLKKMMTDKYCPRGEIKKLEIEMMFPEESDKIEKYVGGLPDMIHGSVMASKPKTMQDAIEFATELMDKKISTLQGVAIAYTVGPGERKEYVGTLLLCNKCKFHNNGQCIIKNQGHYRSYNHGNQAGGTGARGMVHALGGGETNQDHNDMEDDINA